MAELILNHSTCGGCGHAPGQCGCQPVLNSTERALLLAWLTAPVTDEPPLCSPRWDSASANFVVNSPPVPEADDLDAPLMAPQIDWGSGQRFVVNTPLPADDGPETPLLSPQIDWSRR